MLRLRKQAIHSLKSLPPPFAFFKLSPHSLCESHIFDQYYGNKSSVWNKLINTLKTSTQTET